MSFMSQPWLVSATIEKLASEIDRETPPREPQSNFHFIYSSGRALPSHGVPQKEEPSLTALTFFYPPPSHASLYQD